MNSVTLKSGSAEETFDIGRRIGQKISAGMLILLEGELGTGKTVLAKGIGAGLGVKEEITSPTFNLMLRYEGRFRMDHWDLYRIDEIDEDQEFLESIYDASSIVVIEWAERFNPPDDLTKLIIRIEHSPSSTDDRILCLTTDEETFLSVVEPLKGKWEEI